MAGKEAFTEIEWAAMRDAPHLVALAMTMAGASGVLGSIGELFASAKSMHNASTGSNALIRLLVESDEMTAARASLKNLLAADSAHAPEAIQATALSRAQAALAAVTAKSPSDTAEYRAWMLTIAKSVSEASKEGGFLGFGGELVSEKERDFLSRLESALR